MYWDWMPTALDEYWLMVFYALPAFFGLAFVAEIFTPVGRAAPALPFAIAIVLSLGLIFETAFWAIPRMGFFPTLKFAAYSVGYCLMLAAALFGIKLLLAYLRR